MLCWRLLLGTSIIAALVGLCVLDAKMAIPGVVLLPVAVVVALLATREVLDLAAAANLRPLRWAVYCGNLLIVGSNASLVVFYYNYQSFFRVRYSDWQPLRSWFSTEGPMWSLAIAAMIVFLGEIRRYREPGGIFANIAAALFAFVYVGVMLSLAVDLRLAWGLGGLASWVIVVKMGDTGAYTVGRLIGRHKMAPLISPGKTIEGALGGLAFSCLGAWLTFRWLVPHCVPESVGPGPWWGWMVFGVLVGAAGMVGDLAESLLKRDAGLKDSSTWLPGFGGVLDIIDSLLLSAPVAWACWAFGLVGR